MRISKISIIALIIIFIFSTVVMHDQNQTIQMQREAISQMMKNPACLSEPVRPVTNENSQLSSHVKRFTNNPPEQIVEH